MSLQVWRVAAVAAVMLASAVCMKQASAADCGAPCSMPMFNNYYVGPGYGGSVGAQLYLSPRPSPPLVGHTYYTYQPLMPHEYLYHHHTTYVTKHSGNAKTVTHVTYRSFRIPTYIAGAVNAIPILPH